ncbi:hypothetical protein PENTCL1PPCAC_22069 [Pristionchus entomophagus]|uniref:Uncharacterized protein n=1 Tax=Pristionchus entomophagus TaxID=358040 RepID=A0AAV5U180_9BILA|nr:hypothetical protein PENTCL1PPCAC_22069 [Pristionchus entomophagus]
MTEDREKDLRLAKEEDEQPEFEAGAFLSLLRDDQILMGGFDLDEAIAETEGLSRPNSGDGAVEATEEELMMRLEMDGEDPVSDAEGENEEEEEWPPREPGAERKKDDKSGEIAEMTRSMMARVDRMARMAEEKAKKRETTAVTGSRLNQGRSFNVNSWKAEELKELYDGVKKSGTSKPALVRLYNHSEYIIKTKTIEQVYDKIDDIRQMNEDHKTIAIREEKLDAHDRGTLRFAEMGKLAFIWSQQMQKLQNSRSFSRKKEYVKDQLKKFFTARYQESEKVTTIDGITIGPNRPIRWSRLYSIARFIFSCPYRSRNLPARIGINAMEAAVLMMIMNDIQNQARANLTARTRAEHGSMFLALARQDYTMFNLDVPPTDYAKPFVDPLRMSEWRAVSTEEEPEMMETYEEVFPTENTVAKIKGKKRVRVLEEEGEDLMSELAAKRSFVEDLLGEESD